MKLSRALNLFLVSILIPHIAFATPEETNYQLKWNFTPKALKVGDVEGVWFPQQDAEFLLRLRTEYVPTLDSQVDELKLKIGELDGIVKTQQEQRLKLDEKYAAANEARIKCVEQLVEAVKPTPWYESPFFWGTVGLLIGAGVGVYLGSR